MKTETTFKFESYLISKGFTIASESDKRTTFQTVFYMPYCSYDFDQDSNVYAYFTVHYSSGFDIYTGISFFAEAYLSDFDEIGALAGKEQKDRRSCKTETIFLGILPQSFDAAETLIELILPKKKEFEDSLQVVMERTKPQSHLKLHRPPP